MIGNVSSSVMKAHLSYFMPQIPKQIGFGQEIGGCRAHSNCEISSENSGLGHYQPPGSVKSSPDYTKPNCDVTEILSKSLMSTLSRTEETGPPLKRKLLSDTSQNKKTH
uniref:Uncharacterized protein n=1 Tax=Lepeophtheirus salmonis TaxID=72036 RepID=A0A0K2V3X3_LEPSM